MGRQRPRLEPSSRCCRLGEAGRRLRWASGVLGVLRHPQSLDGKMGTLAPGFAEQKLSASKRTAVGGGF